MTVNARTILEDPNAHVSGHVLNAAWLICYRLGCEKAEKWNIAVELPGGETLWDTHAGHVQVISPAAVAFYRRCSNAAEATTA